jgi:hypothetical protein
MIPVIPWYITFIVIATNLTVAVAVWSLLSSATGRSGLPPAAQRAVRIGSAAFLGAWLGAVLLFAPAPASLLARDRFYITPLIPLFVVAPMAIAGLALWRSSSLRRVLAAVPLPALHGVQFYRIIGMVFLILLALGQIPAHFALPAGWGDVMVGLTAPLVAVALIRGVRNARLLAISWNVFGLLDLAVAVGMGTGLLAPLLAPELGSRVPPTGAMGAFPMILVPAFAAPISVLLHLLALGGSLRGVRVSPRLVPTAAR